MQRLSLTGAFRRSPAHTLLYTAGLILLPVSVPAQDEARSHDEAAIRTLIADQVAAWNAGDAKAFSASFAEDGSFTNIRGTVFHGHRAFADRHEEIFRTFFYGSRLAMSPTRINFVRPDVAIVDISTQVSELKGRTPPGIQPRADGKLHTRLQQVMVKDGNGWRVRSYHNVDVKEDKPAPASRDTSSERAVRTLDDQERRAALQRDVPALERLWSDQFTVNAPNNRVVKGKQAVLDTFVHGGIINFSTFDRTIEFVHVDGDLVYLMGAETVTPKGAAPRGSQPVRRRFTNIWRNEGGTWRLFMRHANVIPPS